MPPVGEWLKREWFTYLRLLHNGYIKWGISLFTHKKIFPWPVTGGIAYRMIPSIKKSLYCIYVSKCIEKGLNRYILDYQSWLSGEETKIHSYIL